MARGGWEKRALPTLHEEVRICKEGERGEALLQKKSSVGKNLSMTEWEGSVKPWGNFCERLYPLGGEIGSERGKERNLWAKKKKD